VKIDLCLFSYRTGPTSGRMAIDNMVLHSRQMGVDVDLLTYGNALIHRSRNEALAHARPDSDVLFVDDDMVPQKDALLRLIDAGRPVISALCTTRVAPVRIAAKVYSAATGEFGWLERVNLSKVVDGPFAPGTAFLLMTRDTIDKVREYHLSARDWVDENSRLLSRLHVRTGLREAERKRREDIRRGLWELNRWLRIFDFPVNDDERQLGEDISLGRKLFNLRIPVALDGTTPVGHLGEYAWSVYDIIDKQIENERKEPQYAVEVG
jgi:hypothetical protein